RRWRRLKGQPADSVGARFCGSNGPTVAGTLKAANRPTKSVRRRSGSGPGNPKTFSWPNSWPSPKFPTGHLPDTTSGVESATDAVPLLRTTTDTTPTTVLRATGGLSMVKQDPGLLHEPHLPEYNSLVKLQYHQRVL